jgi:hypothetical protein
MDMTARQLLETFAQTVDKTALDCEEWTRFYDFAIYVHVHQLQIPAWEVRDNLLLVHGFSIQKASWLSTEFNRFSEVLARYDTQRFHTVYRLS